MDVLMHRRQFVIGPEPYRIRDDWEVESLGDGLYLSRCPSLPIAHAHDSGGHRWTLLGAVVQSDPDRATPAADLARRGSEDLEGTLRTWTGRWVLAGKGEVRMDASGLLGCFVRVVDRETWVSSSPVVLAKLRERPHAPARPPLMAPTPGMNWRPPPSSGFVGITRLLPSQVLRFGATGRSVEPRWLVDRTALHASYDDAVETLRRHLMGAMAALGRIGRPWLGLSGGHDSRMLLAAAHAAGVDIQPYTFTKPFHGMSAGDRRLPPRLAAEVGMSHRFVRPERPSNARGLAFDAHTGGHCLDIDRAYLVHNQWARLPEGSISLRGGVFEAGRCLFYERLESIVRSPADVVAAVAHAFSLLPENPTAATQLAGLQAWATWMFRTTPPEPIDWRDRFYLEQRAGGWRSSTEHGLDMTGRQSVHPANCGTIISALLALPEDARRTGSWCDDLVERMAPQLGRFPYNPPKPPLDRWRRRLERERYRAFIGDGVSLYARSLPRRVRGRLTAPVPGNGSGA